MTLLGVGSQGAVGTAGGTTTTLGRIGTGYIYADWNGQIAYTTPNMNGLSLTLVLHNHGTQLLLVLFQQHHQVY